MPGVTILALGILLDSDTVPANWIRAAYSSCPREGEEEEEEGGGWGGAAGVARGRRVGSGSRAASAARGVKGEGEGGWDCGMPHPILIRFGPGVIVRSGSEIHRKSDGRNFAGNFG